MRHSPLVTILTVSFLAVVNPALAPPAAAQQASETDRLREALRSAIAQTRTLEDQRAAMQAKLTEADRAAAQLKSQLDAAKAQVTQLDNDYRQAVQDFNARLEERSQTLEKWKGAYEEAAGVARSKDADRAKFESESKAYKARTTSCEAKNAQLIKISREVAEAYRNLDLPAVLGTTEPLVGIGNVDRQNRAQDYVDKILGQKVQPAGIQ